MSKKRVVIATAAVTIISCLACLVLARLTGTTPAPEATATTAAITIEPPAPMDTPAPTLIVTPTEPTATPTPEMFVTMDGYDSASESIIDPINLWIDYDDRSAGIAAKTNHGEKVKLIRREGDGVLVETAGGVQGWVTYYFIREFK